MATVSWVVQVLALTALLTHSAVGHLTAVDPCSEYPTCDVCVEHALCGWCSQPVEYAHHRIGKQCAGFGLNSSTPFVCNGIFSTEQCVAGYVCDPEDFTCKLAAPGSGSTLEACESNCTNNGQVYLCDHASHTCNPVSSSMPNNGSLASCSAVCAPNATGSPSSPSPLALTYLCNMTSGKCEKTTPGQGTSLQLCEQACQVAPQPNATYTCNTFLKQCVLLPHGTPGESLAECETECMPTPKPNPPAMFLGMWRGIELQNDYQMGEIDMNVTMTEVRIVEIASATTIVGVPMTLKTTNQVYFVINITSGVHAGKVMRLLGEPANRGPETLYMTAAVSAIGGPLPTSIDAAMVSKTEKVWFMSQCSGTPECVFIMPSTLRQVMGVAAEENVVDRCSQYGSSCSDCLANEYCGWCSTNVTYKGGVTGSQCAGFDPTKTQEAFVCAGRYSTFSCTQGYDCQSSTGKCVPDPISGNGMPLNVCEEVCHLTPPPQNQTQYICNITTKQCTMCNDTFCPGGMPEQTCAAACAKPHHGPRGLVKGIWRGLQIQNQYPLGEYELYFNESSLTLKKEGTTMWKANVTSYGGDVMQLAFTSGPNRGKTRSAIYTVQNQGGPLYSIMTLAFGKVDGNIPQSYTTPMEAKGDEVYVLAKCIAAPCQFS